jgi:hypothetical protein
VLFSGATSAVQFRVTGQGVTRHLHGVMALEGTALLGVRHAFCGVRQSDGLRGRFLVCGTGIAALYATPSHWTRMNSELFTGGVRGDGTSWCATRGSRPAGGERHRYGFSPGVGDAGEEVDAEDAEEREDEGEEDDDADQLRDGAQHRQHDALQAWGGAKRYQGGAEGGKGGKGSRRLEALGETGGVGTLREKAPLCA